MTAMSFLLAHEVSRIASECTSATGKLHRLGTLREVAQLTDIHVRSDLRQLVRPEVQRLQAAAERRAEDIVREHLVKLRETASITEAKSLFGRYMMRDWVFLRGRFPRVYAIAEQESRKILHSKQ